MRTVKRKKPYARYMRLVGDCSFSKSGFSIPVFIPYGWERYQIGNVANGFCAHAPQVPRYWFKGNLVHQLGGGRL